MAWVRTIFAFGFIFLTMICFVPIALCVEILRFIGLKGALNTSLSWITRTWGRLSIMFTGCKVTISGRENVPPKGGFCVVSNHGSIFDIVLILASVGRYVGFIAKKELAWIPLLNLYILVLGGLFIDRRNPRKALVTIKKGIAHIKKGGVMLIFPEGHRSRGQGLLPFKAGALKLASKAETLILPVAIKGSYDAFEKTGLIRPVPVEVIIGAPIDTAAMSPEERRRDLPDKVRAVIAGMLETAQPS